MILVATVLLLLAVLAFVGYPLLWPAEPTEVSPTEPAVNQLEHLLAERENAFAALSDLELEHSIGNLSDGDYAALRGAQRHRAVTILRELDTLGAPVTAGTEALAMDQERLDERLEVEIARVRSRLDASADDTSADYADDRAEIVRCSGCDAVNAAQARFCNACGRPLGAATTCPACGAVRSRHDAFCAACGAGLEQGSHDT